MRMILVLLVAIYGHLSFAEQGDIGTGISADGLTAACVANAYYSQDLVLKTKDGMEVYRSGPLGGHMADCTAALSRVNVKLLAARSQGKLININFTQDPNNDFTVSGEGAGAGPAAAISVQGCRFENDGTLQATVATNCGQAMRIAKVNCKMALGNSNVNFNTVAACGANNTDATSCFANRYPEIGQNGNNNNANGTR